MGKILYNARIYTLDKKRAIASVMVIGNGRILETGDDLKSISLKYTGMDKVDIQGRTILPGLTDAHIHTEQYALGLLKVDCETHTKEECLLRVAKKINQMPAGEWVLGHGWNQNNWADGYGSLGELDSIAPINPVFLTAKSLHAAWVNTAALRKAGVNQDILDPSNGKIGRNENGELNGILFEGAIDLVSQFIPEPSPEIVSQAITKAQPRLWAMGLTGLHDFDRKRCFQALQLMHANDLLHLRVIKSIPLEDLEHAVSVGLRTGFGDEWLRIGSIKAFSDGALGPRTAAMLQPYDREPENRGILMIDAEELYEVGQRAVENGLSLAVHAIGDRANHEILDGFTQLRIFERKLLEKKAGGKSEHSRSALRHRIEHVQLIHPDDAHRLAQLGVIASMQPIHATSDMEMADKFWGERATFSYGWRTQLQNGAILAFGSDAPVESPNPFWGIHAAVTRRRQNGEPSIDGWFGEQRLTVEEAILGFTTGAAYAAGLENQLGKLDQGYFADLIVLNRDPFTCEPEEIASITSEATMVGGEWVYQR